MSSYLNHFGWSLHGLVLAAATSTTKASTTKSPASNYSFLIIIGIFGVLYMVFIRPRSQQRRRQMQQGQQVDIGDEVMLTSGIIGRVMELDGDRASIEIAPEIEIEVVRRAISQKLPPAVEETDSEVSPDPADEDDDDYAHASDDLAGNGDDVHDPVLVAGGDPEDHQDHEDHEEDLDHEDHQDHEDFGGLGGTGTGTGGGISGTGSGAEGLKS